MIAPMDDIFYQPQDSADWKLLNREVYTLHEFQNPEKIVKAYYSFYDYVAIANAATSKGNTKEETGREKVLSYIK